MTDNEIIQALERSLQMGDAPIGAHWGVLLTTKLLSDSLDLIKRQQAENERLNGDLARDNNVPTKWISVKDRLPVIPEGWAESPDRVLYMMKNTKTIFAGYYGEGGVWRDKYFREYADSREGVDADDVLCWMYQHDLPQPPKGE